MIALLVIVIGLYALARAVRGAKTQQSGGEQPDDSYPKGWLR